MHRIRLFARRYNQAALLCRALGRSAGLLVVPDLLVRRRNTPPQGRLSPAARRQNMAGAFAVAVFRAFGAGGGFFGKLAANRALLHTARGFLTHDRRVRVEAEVIEVDVSPMPGLLVLQTEFESGQQAATKVVVSGTCRS